MAKRVLAFDLGASSGRALLAEYENGRLSVSELHRFANEPVMASGTLCWDILRLFHEIKQGLVKAARTGGLDSLGIDTWGVDFGLLDATGHLMENPVHYRDTRTSGMMDEVLSIIGKQSLYAATGIQFMEINTLIQLASLMKKRPHVLKSAQTMLLIPDLLNYLLTGKAACEYSIASTTQMLDACTRDWSWDLIKTLGIPERLLPPVTASGTFLGTLSEDIQNELGIGPVIVIATASHDTASAVVSIPSMEKDPLYISCGTWSLIGTERDEPVLTEQALAFNLTNEGGFGGKIRLLKNVAGTWLLQESRRQWQREGHDLEFSELEQMALASRPFLAFIDPDAPEFIQPGNMPERIRHYCLRTGQEAPRTIGETVRCIYESLSLKYRKTLLSIEECTHNVYKTIHMIGGGAKSRMMCQMTASACGLPVVAGPYEATALGNIAVQLIALGEIRNLSEARQIIAANESLLTYKPADIDAWHEAYRKFEALLMQFSE